MLLTLIQIRRRFHAIVRRFSSAFTYHRDPFISGVSVTMTVYRVFVARPKNDFLLAFFKRQFVPCNRYNPMYTCIRLFLILSFLICLSPTSCRRRFTAVTIYKIHNNYYNV